MKKTCFSDNQIVNMLKQAEQGVPIADLCLKACSTTGVLNMVAWMLRLSLVSKSLKLKMLD